MGKIPMGKVIFSCGICFSRGVSEISAGILTVAANIL